MKVKSNQIFLNKIQHLSLGKLICLLALLVILGLVIFCAFRLEPHYISSKEAFIGNLYRGKIIPFIHDNEKAKKYLTSAIVNNNNEAVCDLGEIYAQEKNYRLAGFNYLTAALNGSHRCEVYFIKLSYPNEELVFQILKSKADKNSNPVAQFMVGKRLIEGVGVLIDPKAGIVYLEKAAMQKHLGAKIYLAGIYIKGELLPQDIDKANELMSIKNKTGEK